MIKFFRRIRQDMLAANKLSKYLLYALGEILLVVIGILLALQIDNWNQQRIEDSEEVELLTALKGEFLNNLDVLNESIRANKEVTESCFKLTRLIRADSLSEVPELVDQLLVSIGDFYSFDARTGISGEIVNSGKLAILKNDALREQLGNWLTIIEDSNQDILFRSDNYTINLMPFLMKRFPLANGELTKELDFDRNNYLETYQEASPFQFDLPPEDFMEFENQIWHHKHNHDYVVINELNLKDFIKSTLQMIEGELSK